MCWEAWWTGPGLLLLLSLPVSASPPPVLPTNHIWQGTRRTLSTPMDEKSCADLSQSRVGGGGWTQVKSAPWPCKMCCSSWFEGCRISINYWRTWSCRNKTVIRQSVICYSILFIYMMWEDQMLKSLNIPSKTVCVCVGGGNKVETETDDVHGIYVSLSVWASANMMEITSACLAINVHMSLRLQPRESTELGHTRGRTHVRTVNTVKCLCTQEDPHAETLIGNGDATHHQWHLKYDEYFNDLVKRGH